MIIQNTTNVGQASQPGSPIADAGPRAVAPTSAAPVREPSLEQLKQAVDNINSALQPTENNLQFSIDPGTQRAVVKVTDTKTGDVIRQIPSKEILAIAESIDNFNKGLLLSQKA